jgi:sensor histidine kinase YesM
MRLIDTKHFNRFYLRLNLICVSIGCGIAIVICIFQSAIDEQLVSFQRFASLEIFSTMMTLCVTNLVYVYECNRKQEKKSLGAFILLYNLGLVAGTEISYLLLALIFHVRYNFRNHFGDYRLTLLIGLVLAVVIYFYRTQQASMNARLREKELDLVKVMQLKTQAELQTLQSKINPHFLYNALNSIASLVKEDADKAEDMTLKLSRLFRYSVNSPQGNMASVTEEMEIVNTYLSIEKVRFGDRINFTTHINADVAGNLIPRFLIQPLVENALKHGLSDVAGNGELNITITTEGENITITVADNGKPFPAELNMGYGLQSTYDKLNLLYGTNYQLQIINSPQKQIRIEIPLTI